MEKKTLIKITAFNFVFKLARALAHQAVGLFGSWDRCCKRPYKNCYLTIFNSSFKYQQHLVFKLDILLIFKEESLQVKLCKMDELVRRRCYRLRGCLDLNCLCQLMQTNRHVAPTSQPKSLKVRQFGFTELIFLIKLASRILWRIHTSELIKGSTKSW